MQRLHPSDAQYMFYVQEADVWYVVHMFGNPSLEVISPSAGHCVVQGHLFLQRAPLYGEHQEG